MTIIQTHLLTETSPLTPHEAHQVYNGLDCCVTLEVHEELSKTFNQPPEIYSFERALQAPYMAMMLRGFAVDEITRRAEAQRLRARLERLQGILDVMARGAWHQGLNPRSPKQLAEFFFGALRLPVQYISQKGVRRVSTNREALEKLEVYLHARPFIAAILSIRDIGKQLDVFESEIDPDGRFRTSYNIAGTETGRPSSSTNAFGTGGNAQNIAPGLRHVFVADPGWKLCVIDLEQVEARDVGFFCGCLFDDWSFLDACEAGDLHTANARLVWPELPWTGDIKSDRKIAEQQFYRDFSYRDMAKRGSHLSNYSGTAWTMGRSLKIPLEVAEEFQARYCRGREANPAKGLPAIAPAYPVLPRWWQWTATELQTTGHLTTPFGRRRHFFGRPDSPETIREAIANLPQSTTADRTNLGLWRIWRHQPRVQVLAQTYDSVTFQAPDDAQFDDEVEQALRHIEVELVAPNGRRYVVPGEAKVGWNWGNQGRTKDGSVTNPEGLMKWKRGADNRERRTGLKRMMQ